MQRGGWRVFGGNRRQERASQGAGVSKRHCAVTGLKPLLMSALVPIPVETKVS